MNAEPGPLDLSALDPSRDPERWAGVVEGTRRRVATVLREQVRARDPLEVVGGWARPILAAAAALLLLLGAVDAMLSPGRSASGGEARRLARLTEHALLHGRAPRGAELLDALRPEGRR